LGSEVWGVRGERRGAGEGENGGREECSLGDGFSTPPDALAQKRFCPLTYSSMEV